MFSVGATLQRNRYWIPQRLERVNLIDGAVERREAWIAHCLLEALPIRGRLCLKSSFSAFDGVVNSK